MEKEKQQMSDVSCKPANSFTATQQGVVKVNKNLARRSELGDNKLQTPCLSWCNVQAIMELNREAFICSRYQLEDGFHVF